MDRKLDLLIDLQYFVHHFEEMLMQQFFECRELEKFSMLYRRSNPLEDLLEEIHLHDIRLCIGNLKAVIGNEAMLALKVTGGYRLDDNMHRKFQQQVPDTAPNLLLEFPVH